MYSSLPTLCDTHNGCAPCPRTLGTGGYDSPSLCTGLFRMGRRSRMLRMESDKWNNDSPPENAGGTRSYMALRMCSWDDEVEPWFHRNHK